MNQRPTTSLNETPVLVAVADMTEKLQDLHKKMKDLAKIKYWLFDLDNTLYDGATKVFEQVDKKMTKFISEKLNVGKEEARKIQKNYFQEYNTTLNGMIKHHKIDADEFLEFVHDVVILKITGKTFCGPNGMPNPPVNLNAKK